MRTRSSPLRLERVLGLTSINNSSFTSSPDGSIFYAAGSIVVKYNPEENKQKDYYRLSKPVSSITLSKCGKYLAVGDRGHTPSVVIFNMETNKKIAILQGHKHGVGCLAFSPDGRYLVTVGYKHDKQLLLWDWKEKKVLSTQKVGNKVNAISYHEDGEFFVTAGDRHLKWWLVNEILDGEAISLEGKPASIIEDLRSSVFMDVKCGSDSTDKLVFCTSTTGVLCVFNESMMVEKWMQLESPSSYSIELFCEDGTPGLLLVGCANGIVRCFSPQTLQYIATLPLPSPLLGGQIHTTEKVTADTEQSKKAEGHRYAAVYALRKVAGTKQAPIPKLSVVYADRSLFVWDISDIYAVVRYRSFTFHRACIWDLQFIEGSSDIGKGDSSNTASDESRQSTTSLPHGTFVTCSADQTIRFWCIDPKAQKCSKFRSVYSREMLHAINLQDPICGMENKPGSDPNEVSVVASTATIGSMLNTSNLSVTSAMVGGRNVFDATVDIPDTELPDRPQGKGSPRCIAIHPNCSELACGDKAGQLKIFDLSSMELISGTQAHAAEVLTLSYSPVTVSQDGGKTWSLKGSQVSKESVQEQETVLLASAGRDRLIHIFDASKKPYFPLDTLDHHSSSVTIVKFTSDGRRFVSCGGDRTIVFNTVSGHDITHMKSVQTPHGTINGLAIEASDKFAVTSGQDRRLNIWNLNNGKHMRAYKNEKVTSELYKSDVDPSGMYIATCAFDKTVKIFDFFSGDLVGQVAGHGELITGVKFSPDGRRLLSVSGDGCIMVWKVADLLVQIMQERLMELVSVAQRKNLKATVAAEVLRQSHNVILPPAPPGVEDEKNTQAPSSNKPTVAGAIKVKTGSGLNNSNPDPKVTNNIKTEVNSSVSVSSSTKKNQWIAKASQQDGYELFGRKIIPGDILPENRNKFTLELTHTVKLEEHRVNDAPNVVSKPENNPESDTSKGNFNNISGEGSSPRERKENTLASTLEAQDEVMISSDVDDDDDENTDYPFKPPTYDELQKNENLPIKQLSDTEDQSYTSDFEDPTTTSEGNAASLNGENAVSAVKPPSVKESDDSLDQTFSHLDELEKTAESLENWLEDMIRSESHLDEAVSSTLRKSMDLKPKVSTDPIVDNGNLENSSKISDARKRRKVLKRLNNSVSGGNLQNTNAPGKEGKDPSQVKREGLEEVSAEDNAPNLLNQSLSSAFFKNLHSDGEKITPENCAEEKHPVSNGALSYKQSKQHKPLVNAVDNSDDAKRGDDLLPPPPLSKIGDSSANVVRMEQKQRDTAAAIAQMRERLRAMGALNDNGGEIPHIKRSRHTATHTPDKHDKISKKNDADAEDQNDEILIPPPPPDEHQEKRKNVMRPGDDGYDSADTVSGDDGDAKDSTSNVLLATTIAAQLHQKTAAYKVILRELEEAKQRAAASYLELSQLRSSLNDVMLSSTNNGDQNLVSEQSTSQSSSIGAVNEPMMTQSLVEADQLLGMFRESFTSLTLSSNNNKTNGTSNAGTIRNNDSDGVKERQLSATTQENEPSVELLTAVLDKYSDKLVGILGDKLLTKLGSSATLQVSDSAGLQHQLNNNSIQS